MVCNRATDSSRGDIIAGVAPSSSPDQYPCRYPPVHPDRINSDHGPCFADSDVPLTISEEARSLRLSGRDSGGEHANGISRPSHGDIPDQLTGGSVCSKSAMTGARSSAADSSAVDSDRRRSPAIRCNSVGHVPAELADDSRRSCDGSQRAGPGGTVSSAEVVYASEGDVPDQLTGGSVCSKSAMTGARSSAADSSAVDSDRRRSPDVRCNSVGCVPAELADNSRRSCDGAQRAGPGGTVTSAEVEYASEAKYNNESRSARPSVVWYDDGQGPDERKSVVSRATTISSESGANSSYSGNDDEPSVQRPQAVVSGSEPSLPRPDSTVDELDGTSARRSQSDFLP